MRSSRNDWSSEEVADIMEAWEVNNPKEYNELTVEIEKFSRCLACIYHLQNEMPKLLVNLLNSTDADPLMPIEEHIIKMELMKSELLSKGREFSDDKKFIYYLAVIATNAINDTKDEARVFLDRHPQIEERYDEPDYQAIHNPKNTKITDLDVESKFTPTTDIDELDNMFSDVKLPQRSSIDSAGMFGKNARKTTNETGKAKEDEHKDEPRHSNR